MILSALLAAVALLPPEGTNLVFKAWEHPEPFTDYVFRPETHDFTAYDRFVLDTCFLGEDGESTHLYFAGDGETFGKDDVLADRRVRHAGLDRWVFPLRNWPKCTDPKSVTRIRISMDHTCGAELWVKGMTLLKPGEALPAEPTLTDKETTRLERYLDYRRLLHGRAFRRQRNAFVNKCVRARQSVDYAAIGIADSMSRVRPREGFDASVVGPASAAVLRLAAGEHEALQVVVMPVRKALTQVEVVCKGEPDGLEVKCSPMGYVRTTMQPSYAIRCEKDGRCQLRPTGIGWWPDPILTYTNSCDIAVDDVQSFWIDVRALPGAAPGIRRLKLSVTDYARLNHDIQLMVHVRGFGMPAVSPLPLLVAFNPRARAGTVGKAAAEAIRDDPQSPASLWKRHRDEWGDFLADHFVMMDDLYTRGLPYLDQLKRMKEQNRLGDFQLGYWNPAFGGDEDWRKAHLGDLRRNYAAAREAGLLERAWLYGADEVPLRGIGAVDRAAALLHAEFPGARVMTTAQDYTHGTVATNLDAFCPHTPKFVEHAKAIPAAREAGRQVWWYVCEQPHAPWANMYVECPPMEARLLMGAMVARERPDGFLYYEIAYWNSPRPITGGPFTDWDAKTLPRYHGDGSWVCCGPDGVPLSTQRFENFRDGLEDLVYVKLAEARLGKRLNVPDGVVHSMTEFTDNPSLLRSWRDRLATVAEGR